MQVTHIIVLLVLFVLLLTVGLLLLSGIVPGFQQVVGNASCALGACP